MERTIVQVLFLCLFVIGVRGHGRLVEPPSRSSMWRFGFQTPPNYDDNGLNCGGKQRQWSDNGGKCGVCGDPYDGDRANEAGGKYATGTIVRTYDSGQRVNINVEITAAHGGWFEFRLCPNNDPNKVVTFGCLDGNVLREVVGGLRHEKVPFGAESGSGLISMQYQLPENLTCSQCVLQWKYHTAKDWGCEMVDGSLSCAVGKGPQEEFYGCADVAIRGGSFRPSSTRFSPGTTTTKADSLTTTTQRNRVTTSTGVKSTDSKIVSTKVQATSGSVGVHQTAKPTQTVSSSRKTTSMVFSSGSDEQTNTAKVSMDYMCQGRGDLEGTLMDVRCRKLCRIGFCSPVFCNDACQNMWV